MKRQFAAFLIGGFAFGVLFGYGLFNALDQRPAAAVARAGGMPSAPPGSAGPPGAGDAPMVAEINDLKRALQQDPTRIDALFRVAQIYGQIGMWESVDPFFEKAAEAAPDDPLLVRQLANIFHDAGQWQRAIAYYDRVLELTPDDPDVLTDRGTCLRATGRFEEALEMFGRAQEVDPQHWQSLFNTVVLAAFDMGRTDLAGQALADLERIKPDAPRLDELRAQLARQAADGDSP